MVTRNELDAMRRDAIAMLYDAAYAGTTSTMADYVLQLIVEVETLQYIITESKSIVPLSPRSKHEILDDH